MEVCEIDGEIKARCTNNDCGHTRDVTESMKRDYRAEIENLKGVTQDV